MIQNGKSAIFQVKFRFPKRKDFTENERHPCSLSGHSIPAAASLRHPKMSVENRAKLFTPFSALRGFDIEILTQEQDRLLVPQIILASDREEEIYRLLNGLHQGDWVTVSYFVPVKTIGGQILGEYTVVSGEVRRVDSVEQLLVLESASVPFGHIHAISTQQAEGGEPA